MFGSINVCKSYTKILEGEKRIRDLNMWIKELFFLTVWSINVVNSNENDRKLPMPYGRAQSVQESGNNEIIHFLQYIDLTNGIMPPVSPHGEREDTTNRSSKMILEDNNVHKNREKRQADPLALITQMQPVSGQQMGGFLTFKGENFESIGSNYSIMIGSTPCFCIGAISNSYYHGSGCR